MTWLERLVDAERHRRIGVELPLMTAEDAIDDAENVTALATAVAMRDAFPTESRGRAFVAAIVAALSGTAH